MSEHTRDLSARSAALIAGFGLLSMAILGFFANFLVLENLVVAGDASATAANIRDAEGLFRVGVVAFVLVAVLDIAVAVGLYIVLRPVNASFALLAALFRAVYAGMLGIALLNLGQVLELIRGEHYLIAFSPEQVNAQILYALDAFSKGWMIGLILFAVHLLIVGYLILKSNFVPSLLGILVILAATGYFVDSFTTILLPNYAGYETLFVVIVGVPAIMGEISFMGWLLIRGGKAQPMSNPDRAIQQRTHEHGIA